MEGSQGESPADGEYPQRKVISFDLNRFTPTPFGGCLIVLFIAFSIFAFIRGCTSDSGGSGSIYPVSVLGHERSYVDGDEMDVFAVALYGDEAEDMSNSALDMKAVLVHELGTGATDEYIDFHIMGDAKRAGIVEPQELETGNNYGHANLSDAFDIWFKMDELKTVETDRISPAHLLELGHVYMVYALGTDVAEKYCDKNQESSRAFCDNPSWKIWSR